MVRDVKPTIMMTRKFRSLFGGLWHEKGLNCSPSHARLPSGTNTKELFKRHFFSAREDLEGGSGVVKRKNEKQFLSYFNVILFIVHWLRRCSLAVDLLSRYECVLQFSLLFFCGFWLSLKKSFHRGAPESGAKREWLPNY